MLVANLSITSYSMDGQIIKSNGTLTNYMCAITIRWNLRLRSFTLLILLTTLSRRDARRLTFRLQEACCTEPCKTFGHFRAKFCNISWQPFSSWTNTPLHFPTHLRRFLSQSFAPLPPKLIWVVLDASELNWSAIRRSLVGRLPFVGDHLMAFCRFFRILPIVVLIIIRSTIVHQHTKALPHLLPDSNNYVRRRQFSGHILRGTHLTYFSAV